MKESIGLSAPEGKLGQSVSQSVIITSSIPLWSLYKHTMITPEKPLLIIKAPIIVKSDMHGMRAPVCAIEH